MDTNSELSFSSVATFDDVIQQDRQRYIRKGYGLFFACLITFLSLYLGPIVMRMWLESIQGYSSILCIQIAFMIYLLILLPCNYVSYALANAYMWVIYTIKWPFFERYKIDNNPWPWDKDPKNWEVLKVLVLKSFLINSAISLTLTVFSSYFIQEQRIDLESYPSYGEILGQLFICMLIEDFTFYWTHRMLHLPYFYRFHKQHHVFYTTVSLATEYAHPFDFALSSMMPSAMGMFVLGKRMHLATVGIWLVMRFFETVDGHCGYEFSWSPYRLLPFSGSSEYHNFHHSHNVGNYSSFFSYLDTIFGTNKDFYKHKALKTKELELQRLRNKFNKKD